MKTEHHEQCRFFNYVNFLGDLDQDVIELIYAVPNGGARSPTEAIRLRAEGVRPGIPDVNIDIPSPTYHGMRIEFKKVGGVTSTAQKRKHKLLRQAGYHVVTCYTADEAIKELEKYCGCREDAENKEGKQGGQGDGAGGVAGEISAA
jgi:hypothetical protein